MILSILILNTSTQSLSTVVFKRLYEELGVPHSTHISWSDYQDGGTAGGASVPVALLPIAAGGINSGRYVCTDIVNMLSTKSCSYW